MKDAIRNRDDDEDDDDPEAKRKKAEDAEGPFDCPDFIVLDKSCTLHMLRASQFEEIEESKKKPLILMKLLDSPIKALAIRPLGFTLAISCENGYLYEWNYNERRMFIEPKKLFEEKGKPTCLDYR